jgi:hypothetical protein
MMLKPIPRIGRPIALIAIRAVLFLAALFLAAGAPAVLAIEGFDPHGKGPGYPECANGRLTHPPSLPAHRIEKGPIRVDGILDEPDWIAAPAATGFTQFEPDRGGKPAEETVLKVVYDDDAIYFGIACCRENGTPITSSLARRDHIAGSDLIRLYLSPYHDMVTGYHFRINPDGVKEDYYNYGDLYHDVSWDAVWDAETSVDPDGWYAEIRIPFSSVRYREADSMTWGLNLFQHIYSNGQRTAWSNWEREQQGFMSRSGTLTGIMGIRPPRQIEITPYFVGSVADAAAMRARGSSGEDWGRFGNAGADLKWGVTADLTLNGTFQPDFGQVEADPSQLNLSPYETFYEEKRPFFIEGAQFFEHPNFNMVYSRRIGTGSENSRIRFAGKLTGKAAGNVSTALLLAGTDETQEGKAHNPFRTGENRTLFAIGRFGKQWGGEMHSLHVMQTVVRRDPSSFAVATRNGYTTGADLEMNFRDRMYQLTGAMVGSVIDFLPDPASPDRDRSSLYGTGSRFQFSKTSGGWRYALTTRHQGDKLDLNDVGYISDPNHYAVQGWLQRVYNADNEAGGFITSASGRAQYYRSWIYADRTFPDPQDSTRALWSYRRGHDLQTNWSCSGDLVTRNCWVGYMSLEYVPEKTDLYATRRVPGTETRGPLLRLPGGYDASVGVSTDSRKAYTVSLDGDWYQDETGSRGMGSTLGFTWVESGRISHQVSSSVRFAHSEAQWIGNFENSEGAIGGVSYAFAPLDQRTWNVTLRSSILFTRDQSLEIYAQPFLTTGSYGRARELARPDSREYRPLAGVEAADRDFAYGAANFNVVYRWEYRPGSTFYLVWTQSRSRFDTREDRPSGSEFDNAFGLDPLFRNQGENRVLLKLTYWIPV